MNRIKEISNLFSRESLRSFFMGKIYPAVVAVIVIVGYFTGLEFYLHLINMALACTALVVCDSLRPVMMPLCSFVFQISMKNTPANFNPEGASNYYFEGARLPILVVSFVAVFIALVYFFIKNRLITTKALSSLPYLIPTGVLTLAFLLGGAFSGEWTSDELGFVLVQLVCWFVIFYIFVLGLKNENAKELTGYFAYITSLIAIILIAEVLEIYLTTDNMMSAEGEFIDRNLLKYGWGVCNTGAQALGVLVPVLFIGAVKNEKPTHRIYYFLIATLAFIGSIMNASRTALLTGAPIYIACIIIYVLKSKHKIRNLIEMFSVLAVVVLVLLPISDGLDLLVDNYLTRGVNDSGRYAIWDHGIEVFKENPIFGLGTIALSKASPYSFTYAEFIPFMMHNTPVHMLAAYGGFGFLAYLFYRVCTVIPFIKKPTFEKSMLGIALLSVIVGSLLENFVFYILPMFYFSVCFAVAEKHIEEEKREAAGVRTAAAVTGSENPESSECASAKETCGSPLSGPACEGENHAEKECAECIISNTENEGEST